MKTSLLFLLLLTSFQYANAQADASDHDASVPIHYFDFSLELVKETPGFSPPVVARAFGYMGLTLYEAVVPGIPTHASTEGIIYGLQEVTDADPEADYHWPTVANNAMALILDSLFRTATPANKDSLAFIRNFYNELFAYQLPSQVYEDSRLFGEAIGRDILDYSRTDGAHEGFANNFPPSYIPPVGEDLWVPFGMQTALQPYWGQNRPFLAIDTTQETLPDPPVPFSTTPGSDFYEEAYLVYETGITLTPERTNIALYWADGAGTITPAGHSVSILNNILVREDANLEEAALAYAKLGISISDAFLACWKAKYIYNLCRPVTYIRQHIDSTWLPLIATPPFPEYPSGHSSQSGAMYTVMTDMFGEPYAFIDSTHGTNHGGPRAFNSFYNAAYEAAQSRLYGGIHYEMGNIAGFGLGINVGNNVIDLFNQLNVGTKQPSDRLDNISIYPNPATTQILVNAGVDMIGTDYQMRDLYGKIVLSGTITHESMPVDVNHLIPGLYVFEAGDASVPKMVFKN